jgi:hypothetical protein
MVAKILSRYEPGNPIYANYTFYEMVFIRIMFVLITFSLIVGILGISQKWMGPKATIGFNSWITVFDDRNI